MIPLPRFAILADALLLLSSLPPAVGAPAATVKVTSPVAGERVPAAFGVAISYAGYARGVTSATGEVRLDGQIAATFSVPLSSNTKTGTSFVVPVDAGAFASGERALTAHVRTAKDATSASAPVRIALDLPPKLAANASYDHAARELVAWVTASDDSGAPTTVLSEGAASTSATFQGTAAMRLAVDHAPGSYVAAIRATDAMGQSVTRALAYEVLDMPSDLRLDYAGYYPNADGSWSVFLTGNVSDPDGAVARVTIATSQGAVEASVSGPTWTTLLAPPPSDRIATWTAWDAHGGRTDGSFAFDPDRESELWVTSANNTTEGLKLEGEWHDPDGGIVHLVLLQNGAAYNATLGPSRFEALLPPVEKPGEYAVEFYATDGVGEGTIGVLRFWVT